jgi:cyclopropane fatty-acyl-phospholipid synthase-like methyltransferase
MSTADFYDTQASRKLHDYTQVNRRIERAWKTICECLPASRILEIGCGVGSVCWRLSRKFPAADIVGVDFSPGNLDIAGRFFSAPNVHYNLMSADDEFTFGTFDLIILMDVYEHIAVADRPELHENIRRSLNLDGTVVLTVPTPRHLAWQRAYDSTEIQPVDEEITPEGLCSIARDLGRDLLMYREVDIWKSGDYAHAVIGRSQFPRPAHKSRRERLVDRFVSLRRHLTVRP